MKVNYNIDEEITSTLIKLCELESEKTGEIYFIFDKRISNYINKIVEVEDDIFYIGNIYEFKILPSMFSYYDTETKIIGRYYRYNYVVSFIESLGFYKNRETNFGPEYEQIWLLSNDNDDMTKSVLRLQLNPNLFIKITLIDASGISILFNSFFNKLLIINSLRPLSKSIFIDLIIKEILN